MCIILFLYFYFLIDVFFLFSLFVLYICNYVNIYKD